MTEYELKAWGKTEHETRIDDLARFRAGHISLGEVQDAAKLRSRREGLSQAETDRALRLARIARS